MMTPLPTTRTAAVAVAAALLTLMLLVVTSSPESNNSSSSVLSANVVLAVEHHDASSFATTANDAANNKDNKDEIMLEDFSNPLHTYKTKNDPVMGGRSTASFQVVDGVGIFQGVVKDVPFLRAPGFVTVVTNDHKNIIWPDVSACSGLQLQVRSKVVDYEGYRISFGTKHAKGGKWHAYGFKANLHVPNSSSGNNDVFETVEIPFADFTDFWDDATGDPIKTCTENADYCPDMSTLQNFKTLSLWGEGVKGEVSLEIKTIRAVGCASS